PPAFKRWRRNEKTARAWKKRVHRRAAAFIGRRVAIDVLKCTCRSEIYSATGATARSWARYRDGRGTPPASALLAAGSFSKTPLRALLTFARRPLLSSPRLIAELQPLAGE